MVYWNAWVAPDSAESGVVHAKVTISSDGSVVESWIINGSGDSNVDASVQRTLKRVTTIGRPFPEGMNEKQKTYNLSFDLKAKKGLQ
jgi:TonB family protein